MFSVKHGVSVVGIQSELVFGLMVAQMVYAERGEPLVITSVTDGEHNPLSYHPAGYAADLRLPVSDFEVVVDTLRHRLGPEWDVVLEDTHIHIELDIRKSVR